VAADARIQADALDNLLGVQTLHLCIGVQFVEIADTQCQIGIGKQFDCFGFSEAHNQSVDVLFNSTFLQQTRKGISSLHQTCVIHISTHNDTARVQVVVQSLRLTQELRTEDDVITVVLFTNRSCKANRNRRLDDHDSIRIILDYQLDDSFNCRSIKEVLLAVIVGRCCDNNEVCILVGGFSVQRCRQVQVFLCQILLNVLVPNRRLLVIDKVNFFRDNIDCHDLMMLGQQRGNGQTDITGTCNCDFHSLSPFLFVLSSLACLMP
jgi:hypothetical protein